MKDIRIEIATVVYYDGVQAYTTLRALFVDFTKEIKLTHASKNALNYDFDCSGCEILKVDFNGRSFNDSNDFIHHYHEITSDLTECEYIRDKFIEYFVVND